MYTPLIGDEKRDVVEYTSLGFMNCAHTMLTYTRAMDSALCVPLMIDAAVWCDYFASQGAPMGCVARALAYLFKVPEGEAKGVDPGFFRQMRALEDALEATATEEGVGPRYGTGTGARAGARAGEGAGADVSSLLTGRVICAGISCLDMQLCDSTEEGGVETIHQFTETKYCPGGSCPQVATALAEMGVAGVVAMTKMGVDAHGNEMVKQMSDAGVDCSRVIRDPSVQTALAVLPIFTSGARGCFVNLAANNDLHPEEISSALDEVAALPGPPIALVHYGYPHFTPKASAIVQGDSLASILRQAQGLRGKPLVSLDLNGVDPGMGAACHAAILGAALPYVDLLHANLEEAEAIAGSDLGPSVPDAGEERLRALAEWFLSRGVVMVSITLGGKGSYTVVTKDPERLQVNDSGALGRQVAAWAGVEERAPAFATGEGSSVNANGAGDAFIGALALAAGAWREPLKLGEAVAFASLAALQRVDSQLRETHPKKTAAELMAIVRTGPEGSGLPPTLPLIP
ncbi:unnamed protein product [Discosporangium mesarthrocarpum]